MRVGDRDDGGAAADGEGPAVLEARCAEDRRGAGGERGPCGGLAGPDERRLRGAERRRGAVDDRLRGDTPLPGDTGVLLVLEPVGEQRRPVRELLPARLDPGCRPHRRARRDEAIARLGDRVLGGDEILLEPVERERDAAALRVQVRQRQHLVHVPVGMVVREDGARDVRGAARRGEVTGRRVHRVLRVPRVGDAVAVRVDAPAEPRRGHELHPPDRTRRARAHVAAEVRLDLVDGGEHLPRDVVGGTRRLPEAEQLAVRELSRRGRRRRELSRHGDRSRGVGQLRARAGPTATSG